jgi:predicted TIM-barrel fold metal-dependent hydrolase
MPAPHRIDVHHHYYPPKYIQETKSRLEGLAPEFVARLLAWNPAEVVKLMDASGIQKAILSMDSQNVWFGDATEARKLSRICNEYAAGLVKEFPGRFGFFASIAYPDPPGAIEEIKYAYEVLGADGVGLISNYDGHYPGEKTFAPVFDELNRRKAIVLIHPNGCDACRQLVPEVTPAMMEFPVDTTRAISSLLFTGTIARCPQIRFIACHGGGVLPMLAHRIANQPNVRPALKPLFPNGVIAEMQKLYFEVNNVVNPSGFSALRNLAPMDHILFGTDNPYVKPDHTIGGLHSLGLSEGELMQIERDNAVRLFAK